MVHSGDDFSDKLFQVPEIHQQTDRIQFISLNAYLDLPVMPVKAFAFFRFHFQLMGGCKAGGR